MTQKLKTGFILSIIAHVLSWAPIAYWGISCYTAYKISQDPNNYVSVHLNYYLFYFATIVAIALCIVSLTMARSKSNEPKVRTYKVLARVFAISGLVLIVASALIVAIAFLYALAFILGV